MTGDLVGRAGRQRLAGLDGVAAEIVVSVKCSSAVDRRTQAGAASFAAWRLGGFEGLARLAGAAGFAFRVLFVFAGIAPPSSLLRSDESS